jgi:hypothetical protein
MQTISMTTVLAALFISSTGIALFSIFRNRHTLDLPRSETEQRIRSRIDPDSSGSLRENAIMAEIGGIINSSLDIEEVYECGHFMCSRLNRSFSER